MQHPHRLLRFNLMARMSLLTQSTTTASLAWLSPGSLTARLLEQGGDIGLGLLCLMTVLVLVGWLDVLANDLLLRAPILRAVALKEHHGYMLLGATFWVQALAGATLLEAGAWVLLLTYIVTGALCCWYGWASAVRGGRRD